ncbi:MAG: hypothetical protein AB7O97_19440 [Planctomycetota bacterium]
MAAALSLALLLWGGWSLFYGVWCAHASAPSPDGRRVAESRDLYRWGPIYGWSHYHVRVRPAARIRCKVLTARWRGTPRGVTEWSLEHHYATYNDFDDSARYPTGVRWLSDSEFVIEGGEGGGSVFEVER